uniref:Secreted protein n=1 Tax=Oryza meridionalis TaxID=40149 RepID=A0A0E0C2N2_9ORYZ
MPLGPHVSSPSLFLSFFSFSLLLLPPTAGEQRHNAQSARQPEPGRLGVRPGKRQRTAGDPPPTMTRRSGHPAHGTTASGGTEHMSTAAAQCH